MEMPVFCIYVQRILAQPASALPDTKKSHYIFLLEMCSPYKDIYEIFRPALDNHLAGMNISLAYGARFVCFQPSHDALCLKEVETRRDCSVSLGREWL